MQSEMAYVYKVFQEKSFTKAAEELFMTQPALSMAIRKVEDSLGMPIFDRSVRPMGLTLAGKAYIEFIENTLNLEQELQQQIQDIREINTGSVRMGGSHYINAYIMPRVLAGFSQKYPRVNIDLVESSSAILSQMLARREVDITFNCNPNFMQGFERYPAFEDHILLAVPKSLNIKDILIEKSLSANDVANRRHLQPDCPCVTLNSFRNLEFILLAPGNNLHDRTEQLFQEANFTPKVRMELSQLVTAYHLANVSLGATFISDRLIVFGEDNLLYYKLDSELTTRIFYMLLPNRKYTSKAVRAFVDYCTSVL